MSGFAYKAGERALRDLSEKTTKEYEDALMAKIVWPLGTKVRRGRDWSYGDQDVQWDGPGVGHVISHGLSRPGTVVVRWETTHPVYLDYFYHWGSEGKFDLLPVDVEQLDLSALSDTEVSYLRIEGLLTYPELGEMLRRRLLKPDTHYGVSYHTEPVVPDDLQAKKPEATEGARAYFRRFKEAMERQLRVGKESTEGERLARFFATSEHDKYRREALAYSVVYFDDMHDADEPRADLCDRLYMPDCFGLPVPDEGLTSKVRLSDAVATQRHIIAQTTRWAEQKRALVALRDDFDNLPDA